MVHMVRMMLELHPEFVCVQTDIENAHNSISRRACVEGLENVPSLRHLAQHAATCLSPHLVLETGGEAWGESGQGATQGDSEAGFQFSVGIHPHVMTLHDEVAPDGGLAVFGNDDGYILGPPEAVFPAVARFAAAIKEECGLNL